MTIELDAAQRLVAEAPPETRQLVIAGAGRGKTEVVAARIDYLQAMHGLYPVDEIAVLSFSRAAVRAVQRRLESSGAGLAAVRTFDSFATSVLLDAGEDIESIRGFETRIRAATEVIERGDSAYTDLLRHVVIDEVQDLVGDRAELALALLRAVDESCGFTVMGDPLQAIYDWQLENARSRTTPTQFAGHLLGDFGARQVTLDKDYRARGRDPKRIISLGEQLRSAPSAEIARELTSDVERELLDLGDLKDATNLLDRERPCAVLCRTNGQALQVSRILRENLVPHVFRRVMEDIGAAPWIAATFAHVERLSLGEEEVRELLAATVSLPLPVDEAWVALKSTEGNLKSHGTLDLTRLRTAMRSRALPIELQAIDQHSLVVSTIHRAKGLEFDKVYIVERPKWQSRVDIDWPEVRLDYVAMSRARDEIYRCAGGSSRIAEHKWSRRYTARTRKDFHRSYAMEALSRDVDVTEPFASDGADARGAQTALADPALINSDVIARLDPRSHPDAPVYELATTSGIGIGRTSADFAEALIKIFGARRPGAGWPLNVDGIVVAAVETVAGTAEDTRAAALGSSGFWLVPRLTGLARPVWTSVEGET